MRRTKIRDRSARPPQPYLKVHTMPSCDSETLEKCVQDPEYASAHWEVLIEGVASSDESILEPATEALENCGVLNSTALPKLKALLESNSRAGLGSQKLYWLCTLAGRFGKQASGLQGLVTEIATDRSLGLSARERAAWCLTEFGTLESQHAEALKRSATDAPDRLKRLMELAMGNAAIA